MTVPMSLAVMVVMTMPVSLVVLVVAAMSMYMVLMLMAVMMVMLLVVVMMPMPVVVVMVMFILHLHHFLHQLRFQILRPLDGLQNIFAVKRIPGRRDDRCLRVVLSDHRHTGCKFLLADLIRPAENNRAGVRDLVDKKFPEVFDIHLTFAGVHHGNSAAKLHIPVLHGILHRLHNVGKFSHTRRFDQNAFWRVGIKHFL